MALNENGRRWISQRGSVRPRPKRVVFAHSRAGESLGPTSPRATNPVGATRTPLGGLVPGWIPHLIVGPIKYYLIMWVMNPVGPASVLLMAAPRSTSSADFALQRSPWHARVTETVQPTQKRSSGWR